MIAKPGKNSDDIASYRPISLLPILTKILEKILLQRLTHIIDDSKLIPSHHSDLERNTELLIKLINDLIESTTTSKTNANAQRPSTI